MRYLLLLFLFGATFAYGQSDTLNQTDADGKRQGFWIIYGRDRPSAGYPLEGRISDGFYVDNRKHGLQTRYHRDGITPLLTGEYNRGRPSGPYIKWYSSGRIKEQGTFRRNKYFGVLIRYYENEVIQFKGTYNAQGKEVDTTFYYYESGCLEYLIIHDSAGGIRDDFHYQRDSCNVAIQNKLPKEHPIGEIIYEDDLKPVLIISNQGFSNSSTYDLRIVDLTNGLIEIHENIRSIQSGENIYTRVIHNVLCKGVMPRMMGYNKLYNYNEEIFIDGEFKSGHFMNGKIYLYDDDGILLRIKVYKNGKYYSDGQL